MKAIIALLVLASIALAQWGPGGIPVDWRNFGLTWMEAAKYTSSGATSYTYFASSAAADSLVWRQTGTVGTRHMIFKFIRDTGTSRRWWYDDLYDWWAFDGTVYCYDAITAVNAMNASGGNVILTSVGTMGILKTSAARPTFQIDVNSAGEGTLIIGEVGDSDDLLIQCDTTIIRNTLLLENLQYDTALGGVRRIVATDTLELTDYQLVVDADANVGLPSAVLAFATGSGHDYGQIFAVKNYGAFPCTLYCAGADVIDGSDSVVVAAWENVIVQAISASEWMRR